MISEFMKGRVYQLWKAGMSRTKIGVKIGISPTTVKKMIDGKFKSKRAVRKTPVEIIKRRNVLKKLANETAKKQHRVWPKFGSAKQLCSALHKKTGTKLSVRQVQRDLHTIGLKPYVRQAEPTRTTADKKIRRAFAHEMRGLSKRKINSIVFSDESWLSCCERTGKIHWTSSRDKVLGLERKARWNVPSIMVWGAVGHNYRSELIIFPSKRNVDGEMKQFRLDAQQYVRRCLSTVVPELARRNLLFQQDGARSHVAKKSMEYLRRKKINVLRSWPAYSPDLNAIERVWKELNTRVGELCPMTQQELVTAAKQVWKCIPSKIINQHCAHFSRQMQAL